MWEVVYRTVIDWRRFGEPFQVRKQAEERCEKLARTHIGFAWRVRRA